MAKKTTRKTRKKEESEIIDISGLSLGNQISFGHVPGLKTFRDNEITLSPRQKAILEKAKVKSDKSK